MKTQAAISAILLAMVLMGCAPCNQVKMIDRPTRSSHFLCNWKIATDSLVMYWETHPPAKQRDLVYSQAWFEAMRDYNKFCHRRGKKTRPTSASAEKIYDYCIGQRENVQWQFDYNERCRVYDSILYKLKSKAKGMGISGALEYLSDPNASYRSLEDDLVALGRLNRLYEIIEPISEDYDRIHEIDRYLLNSFNLNRWQLGNYHTYYLVWVGKKEREERNRGAEYLEVEKRLGLIYKYLDRCIQWVFNFPLLDSSITGSYTPCQWVTMNVMESTSLARDEMRALDHLELNKTQEAKLSEYRELERVVWEELSVYCP
jgi:hypothetical protein